MKTQYHIIYKTKHPNGKFYGGRHSTYDLDDGYLGSGLWVKEMKNRSVLTREIVGFASDFETLVEMEEQWLAENYDDPNCMNFSRSSLGWGSGEANIMNNPEIAAKLSGNKHWTRQKSNSQSVEEIRKKQNELVASGKHIFQTNNPNKDGQNAKLAYERGTHVWLSNNPNIERVANGTHQMFRREDGSSIGGDANAKRIEAGTHNFLGPEMNQARIDAGTHNLLGSDQNRNMLAEGTHPSQTLVSCICCHWEVSVGMFKRWHDFKNGRPQCHLDPDSPRYNPDLKPR